MSGPAAIVLATHGAGDGSASNRNVRTLAATIERRTGRPTHVAFVLGRPHLDHVLDEIDTAHVTVVPLLTSNGYYARRIARVFEEHPLGRAGRVTVRPPIGLDPRLHASIVTHVAERSATLPSTPAIIVIGHGTRRAPDSGERTRALAAAIATRLPDATVRCAFLDEPPGPDQIVQEIDAARIIAVPYLMGGGPHVERDVARRLGAGDDGRIDVLPAIGADPVLLERLVLDTIEGEGSKGSPVATPPRLPKRSRPAVLRLGTRGSRLALWQARRVASLLRRRGVRSRLVVIETTGDRDPTRPLEAFGIDGVFSDELEQALRANAIDAAIHSLKDLPLVTPDDLAIAAVLERDDPTEALVSRGGGLGDLPAAALVGTSSTRRATQLRALRADLRPTPIRGAVERRVAQVDEGAFDAAILATAGLARLGLEGRVTERLARMLPAAGQAVIAVQVRAADAVTTRLVAALDHEPTRRAVTAELELARRVEAIPGRVAATLARTRDGLIVLRARMIDAERGLMRDTLRAGPHPADLARRAAEDLLSTRVTPRVRVAEVGP